MVRRFTVLILLLALSSPTTVVGAAAGLCLEEGSVSPGGMPAEGTHLCCATAEAPESCVSGTPVLCGCGPDPAPYRESGAGALPAFSLVQSDQPDFSTPFRGPRVVEPVSLVPRASPEMVAIRASMRLHTLFCTYLV